MAYGLFIPTKGRVNNQRTLDESLPEKWRQRVTITCSPEEADEHLKLGRAVFIVEHTCVWQSYAAIIQRANLLGMEKVVIMDDDVKFFRRESPDAWNLRKTVDEDFDDLFKRLTDACTPETPLVGIHARQMSNTTWPDTEKFCQRQTMVHVIHVPTFVELGINPSVMTFKGDFYFTLSVLMSGRRNLVVCDWAIDQYGSSNAPGGVSTYRSFEGMEASAHQLYDLFPQVVSVERKKNTWPGFPMPHLDVKIFWQRAYKIGYKNRFGEEAPALREKAKAGPKPVENSLFAVGPKKEGML